MRGVGRHETEQLGSQNNWGQTPDALHGATKRGSMMRGSCPIVHNDRAQ